MSVEQQNFYAQRIAKELRTKDHLDKVVHLHQQTKLASTFGSGSGFHNTQYSSQSNANTDIMRNRAFANHATMTSVTKHRPKPLYFFNTSNGLQACNPNSLRDMGAARNAEYHIEDQMDQARNVKWRDLVQGDEELERMQAESRRMNSTQKSSRSNIKQACNDNIWRRSSHGSFSQKQSQMSNTLNGTTGHFQKHQSRDELLKRCTFQGELGIVPGALLDSWPKGGLKRDIDPKEQSQRHSDAHGKKQTGRAARMNKQSSNHHHRSSMKENVLGEVNGHQAVSFQQNGKSSGVSNQKRSYVVKKNSRLFGVNNQSTTNASQRQEYERGILREANQGSSQKKFWKQPAAEQENKMGQEQNTRWVTDNRSVDRHSDVRSNHSAAAYNNRHQSFDNRSRVSSEAAEDYDAQSNHSGYQMIEPTQEYAAFLRPAGVATVPGMKSTQNSSRGFLDKIATASSGGFFHQTMRSNGSSSQQRKNQQQQSVPVNHIVGTRIMPNKKNDSQLIFSPGLTKHTQSSSNIQQPVSSKMLSGGVEGNGRLTKHQVAALAVHKQRQEDQLRTAKAAKRPSSASIQSSAERHSRRSKSGPQQQLFGHAKTSDDVLKEYFVAMEHGGGARLRPQTGGSLHSDTSSADYQKYRR